MILPSYINRVLQAYYTAASADRRALLDSELFNTDPLSCKKEYLPLLAVEAGVNIDGLEEQAQREIVVRAYRALTKAGTIGYLKDILDVKVEEVEGYVFNLRFPRLSKEQYFNSLKNAKEYKNVRSVLGKVITETESDCAVFVGAYMRNTEIIKIYPKEITKVAEIYTVFIGAHMRNTEIIKIYPKRGE